MRLDYSETSQVLALFTREHGKVRAIAKGVKRSTKTRFAVGIDLLELGQVVLSSRQERPELSTLTEWKQTRSLLGLRERLFRMRAAEYLAEITSRLTEDWDSHVEMFDCLVAALDALNEAAEPLAATVDYQVHMLNEIGLLPRFEACIVCGRGDALHYFSSHEGGMICKSCESGRFERRSVSSTTLQTLRAIVSNSSCRQPANPIAAHELPPLPGETKEGLARPAVDTTDLRPPLSLGERWVYPDTPVSEARKAPIQHSAHPATGQPFDPRLRGPFALLNYHISHLMGRPSALADLVAPPLRTR